MHERGYTDLKILKDITDQKEAETRLRESEEKYRSLFHNSPNAILLIDTNGIIMDCNSTSEKLSEPWSDILPTFAKTKTYQRVSPKKGDCTPETASPTKKHEPIRKYSRPK